MRNKRIDFAHRWLVDQPVPWTKSASEPLGPLNTHLCSGWSWPWRWMRFVAARRGRTVRRGPGPRARGRKDTGATPSSSLSLSLSSDATRRVLLVGAGGRGGVSVLCRYTGSKIQLVILMSGSLVSASHSTPTLIYLRGRLPHVGVSARPSLSSRRLSASQTPVTYMVYFHTRSNNLFYTFNFVYFRESERISPTMGTFAVLQQQESKKHQQVISNSQFLSVKNIKNI